jgi:hypothetical protein
MADIRSYIYKANTALEENVPDLDLNIDVEITVAIHIDHIENTATVIDQTETIDDSDKESLSQTSIVKDEGHSDMETCSSAQDVRNFMLFGPCSPYHFLAPSFSTRYPLSVSLKAIR